MGKDSTHFLVGKRIIVAGAGIAGLSFAVALHKQWAALHPSLPAPSITIFDRDDANPSEDRDGYSISIHGHEANCGLLTLRSLGLLDVALAKAIIGTETAGNGKFKFWMNDWTDLLGVRFKPIDGLPSAGIRIARRDLRRVLIDATEATPTGRIRWSTACTAAEKLANGRVKVTLHETGTGLASEEECDLLIAADGASSKIRGCLRPEDGLEYTGAVQFGGKATFPDGIPAPVDEHWGMLVNGRGSACFFSRVSKDTVVWGFSRLEEQPRLKKREMTEEEFQKLLKEALDLGSDFHEPFQTIVKATDRSSGFDMPGMDKKPFPHSGPLDDGRVVFIGDSNHAVTPFAGNGANLALSDGWELAGELCRQDNLGRAVAAYDKASLPKAWSTLNTSHDRIKKLHSTGLGWMGLRVGLTFASAFMWLRGG